MKKVAILFLSLLVGTGFSQNFWFEHPGGRAAIVKRAELKNAKELGDIIRYYPSMLNKMVYIERIVNLTGVCDGKVVAAVSSGDILSPEQIAILNKADDGTDIVIRIDLKRIDKDGLEKVDKVEYAVTPAPEVEAQFPGGLTEMATYINHNVVEKILSAKIDKDPPQVSVVVTVDEQGMIDARIYRSSADQHIDQKVVEAIKNMPKWKPAENINGETIKQRYIFNFGTGGGGC